MISMCGSSLESLSGSDRRKRSLLQDEVGSLLRDHDHRSIDIAADKIGHHGSIDDAQAIDTAYPQLRIDNGGLVGVHAHLAGAERVIDGCCGSAGVSIEISVRGLVRTGRYLRGRAG